MINAQLHVLRFQARWLPFPNARLVCSDAAIHEVPWAKVSRPTVM